MRKTTEVLLHLCFITGYKQLIPGRSFRRLIAKSQIHRAWLAGNIGAIGEEDGVLYRCWFTNRKHHRNATFRQIWQGLRDYYGLDGSNKSGFLIAAIWNDIFKR